MASIVGARRSWIAGKTSHREARHDRNGARAQIGGEQQEQRVAERREEPAGGDDVEGALRHRGRAGHQRAVGQAETHRELDRGKDRQETGGDRRGDRSRRRGGRRSSRPPQQVEEKLMAQRDEAVGTRVS